MSEFPDYVKQMHLKGKDSFATDFNVRTLVQTASRGLTLHAQYILLQKDSLLQYLQSIPVSTPESFAVGERNAVKNRYKNIFPCEQQNNGIPFNLLATVGQAATQTHIDQSYNEDMSDQVDSY